MTDLGRLLTEEECEWLHARGLKQGYDGDDCDPQLNHIVIIHDADREKITTLCDSPNLWGYGMDWSLESTRLEERRRLQCQGCIDKLDILYLQSVQQTRNGYTSTSETRNHHNLMEDIVLAMRAKGRHDLALVLESVSIAYLYELELSENAIRHTLANVLSLKSDRIRKALALLDKADGV